MGQHPATRNDSLKQLNSRHREVMRRLVYMHQTQAQIAKDLGFNEGYLSIIVNSAIFQSEMEKVRMEKEKLDREAYLHSLATPAIEVTKQVLTKGQVEFGEGESKRVVKIGAQALMETVRDTLDRAGHKPIERKVEAHFDFAAPIIEAWNEISGPDEPRELEGAIDVEAVYGPEDQNSGPADTQDKKEGAGEPDADGTIKVATSSEGLTTTDTQDHQAEPAAPTTTTGS